MGHFLFNFLFVNLLMNPLQVRVFKLAIFLMQNGILRFYGTTEFASGDWAGLELDEPVGKNDGSVGGVAYFTCKPKHGEGVKVE